jgi:gamma-glutamyltranspeptidase/glutathione hydrolase
MTPPQPASRLEAPLPSPRPATPAGARLSAMSPGLPSPGTRYGTRGMVASASPAAAAAGMRVLLEGGNAFDAAIATAMVEGLTIPMMCGLGGDMFAVLYDARTRRAVGINGSGAAPRAATREYYTSRGHRTMPRAGIQAFSVPGAPQAYWTLHQQFGSLPWARLLEPAIVLAEGGTPVTDRLARTFANAQAHLSQTAEGAATFYPDGRPPAAGTLLRRPALGRTLRVLAEEGAGAFYEGPIGAEIVRAAREHGSLYQEADFAAHETEVYEPLHTTYRGVEVYEPRPVSQGLIVLETLNILEGFDLAASGWCTADTIHLLLEAKKLAFADRMRYAGDPRFVDAPFAHLLSKPYAARRRRALDPHRAQAQVPGGLPEEADGDTSQFCVADGEGNAISFIHSLCGGFGSGMVAGATGVVLNNRAGRGFMLEEGHPNVIAGGKKTMHTLTAYLLMRDGALWGVGGTPGGDSQPQWAVQVITNLVDFGLDPQQAADAPRWISLPGTDESAEPRPYTVEIESRVGQPVLDELTRRGHTVVDVGPWGCRSAVQVILRQPDGVLAGGSDPRLTAGGLALGF